MGKFTQLWRTKISPNKQLHYTAQPWNTLDVTHLNLRIHSWLEWSLHSGFVRARHVVDALLYVTHLSVCLIPLLPDCIEAFLVDRKHKSAYQWWRLCLHVKNLIRTRCDIKFQERRYIKGIIIIVLFMITSWAKEDTTNLTAIDPKPRLYHRHASYHLAAILDETRRWDIQECRRMITLRHLQLCEFHDCVAAIVLFE